MPVDQWFLCYCYCMWLLHVLIFYPLLRELNFLLHSVTYLVVHKPKYALVHHKVLCEQNCQCSGQGFLESPTWVSCLPWSKASLYRMHHKVLYEQKCQCNGQGFLESLPWVSCHPWSTTSLYRSCQYEQQSSGPMEWFWLYCWFHKVIAAVSGTLQGIQNLLSRIFYHFQEEFFNNYIFFYKRGGQWICRNIMNKIIQINERKQHQEWPSDHLILSRGFKSASKS